MYSVGQNGTILKAITHVHEDVEGVPYITIFSSLSEVRIIF